MEKGGVPGQYGTRTIWHHQYKLTIWCRKVRYCSFWCQKMFCIVNFVQGPRTKHLFLGRQVIFGLEKLVIVNFDAVNVMFCWFWYKKDIPGANFHSGRLSVINHGVKLSRWQSVRCQIVPCQIVPVPNCPTIPKTWVSEVTPSIIIIRNWIIINIIIIVKFSIISSHNHQHHHIKFSSSSEINRFMHCRHITPVTVTMGQYS